MREATAMRRSPHTTTREQPHSLEPVKGHTWWKTQFSQKKKKKIYEIHSTRNYLHKISIVSFHKNILKIVYVVTCTIVVFYCAIGLILQSVFILIGSSAYDNIKDIQFSAKLMSQKCLKYFKTFRIYIIVIFS